MALLLFAIPLSAQEPWPADANWQVMLDSNWNNMTDPPNDQNPASVDVISNGVPASAYFYASSTSVFYRMVLSDTPISNQNELKPFAWMASIDVNGDGSLDWQIRAAGITEYIQIFCFLPATTLNWQVPNPVSAGYVRAINMGSFYYFDMQVPLTALQRDGYPNNVDLDTPIRFFFHTSTTEAVDIKDATVPTTNFSAAFGLTGTTTLGNASDGYGRINDTRDTSPYSSAGIWKPNETVLVSGSGWPGSGSSYFNSGVRNVRFKDPDGNVVWSGTVTTDATGNFTGSSSWAIPTTAVSGIYSIEVEDPRTAGSWLKYDTFTVENPIAIELYSFFASSHQNGVIIAWHATAYGNTAGFHLWRSTSETSFERITAAMIAEPTRQTTEHNVYEFYDTSGVDGTRLYKLEEISLDGASTFYGPISVSYTSGIAAATHPNDFKFLQNYPNPFNPQTSIVYELGERAEVSLSIHDMNSRVVRVLVAGAQPAGRYSIVWDARNDFGEPVSSGIYIYRLVAGEFSQTHIMTLLK